MNKLSFFTTRSKQAFNIFWLILFLLLHVNAASAEPTPAYTFTSIDDTERYTALTKEIRCVVCQNQSIADSSAPLANDLRQKVYQMVLDKKSNSEIKHYLVKRYGDFILLEPQLSQKTFLLWIFPIPAILMLLLILKRRLTFKQNHQNNT